VKVFSVYGSVLVACLGVAVVASQKIKTAPCWCWSADQKITARSPKAPMAGEFGTFGSYGVEADWTNPDRLIPLDYNQAQGQQIFYQQCVWCHADTTPAGPSNRSNVTPTPPLANDGTVLNKQTDESLRKIIALGGGAMGRSPMMPPHGKLLTPDQIDDVVRFMRVIAIPQYHKP